MFDRLFKYLKKDKKRGKGELAKKANKQMQTGHIASYWTKEFELGADGKINCHYHGILYMKNSGSWKGTLDFKAMKELIQLID